MRMGNYRGEIIQKKIIKMNIPAEHKKRMKKKQNYYWARSGRVDHQRSEKY